MVISRRKIENAMKKSKSAACCICHFSSTVDDNRMLSMPSRFLSKFGISRTVETGEIFGAACKNCSKASGQAASIVEVQSRVILTAVVWKLSVYPNILELEVV